VEEGIADAEEEVEGSRPAQTKDIPFFFGALVGTPFLPVATQTSIEREPPKFTETANLRYAPTFAHFQQSHLRQPFGLEALFHCYAMFCCMLKTPAPLLHQLFTVELQRQFLALRRAGALPLQARLERRSLSSCALLTHKELSFVFSLGASLPPFLPNQVTLQLHFHCSRELRTLSETFHIHPTRSVA